MVFGFQVVCLLVTLVTVFAYIAHHVYSREHRLLPLFLGVIAVFDFYRIVLMLTGAVGLLGGSVGSFCPVGKSTDTDADDRYLLLCGRLSAYQIASCYPCGLISLSDRFTYPDIFTFRPAGYLCGGISFLYDL